MGAGRDVRGLYVHVPFCARRCHFCDFVTGPERPGRTEAYLDAVLAEARAQRSDLPGVPPLDTLFFGGGTPSLVLPRLFARFAADLRAIFPLAPRAEVSLEANPEDVDAAHLDAWREAGVTRLSLGLQSLDPLALRALNRGHSPEQGLGALRRALAAGLESVSVDLLLGIPGEGIPGEREDRFLDGLDRVLGEGIAHLSVYALTLEEKSVFGRHARDGRFIEEADERFERLYLGAIDRAERAGLAQYEISNFARAGHRARHNLLYWTRASVLGLGVGAASTVGGARWRNAGSIDRYVRHPGRPERERDDRGPDALATEAIFLALRLRDGLDLGALAAEFGTAVIDATAGAIRRHVERGHLEDAGGRIRLARAGLLLSDAVFRDLTLLPGDLARHAARRRGGAALSGAIA
jgi:oxygen-independent coproporphyrinogen-3 oxidase